MNNRNVCHIQGSYSILNKLFLYFNYVYEYIEKLNAKHIGLRCMSGIVAIVDRGRHVSSDLLRDLLDTMDYRGHDGQDSVTDGHIGFGHQHFYTTPEAVGERQPLVDDGYALTFDGRIDNRREIIHTLESLSGEESDARIIIELYKEHDGCSFLTDLVGAYAFALYDSYNEKVILARDKVGIRQLYYSVIDNEIIAASDIKSILRHPSVEIRINEGLLAEHLFDSVSTIGETFYEGIQYTIPGTYVTITQDGITHNRYWDPSELEGTLSGDSEQLVEIFLNKLERATKCRLRTRTNPGVMMSGGLDSTAIVAAIDRLGIDTVPTFTHIYTEDIGDWDGEVKRIAEMEERFGIHNEKLVIDDETVLKTPEIYSTPLVEGPIITPTQAITESLYDRAKQWNCTVLLTGRGGNRFDGSRFTYADLFLNRKYRTWLAHGRADDLSLAQLALWYTMAPILLNKITSIHNIHRANGEKDHESIYTESFIEQAQIRERANDNGDGVTFHSIEKQLAYNNHHYSNKNFWIAISRQTALNKGIQLRYPLLDSRIVEFFYAIPSEMWAQKGVKKNLFRSAFGDILPERVISQESNTDVNFDAMIHNDEQLIGMLRNSSNLVNNGVISPANLEQEIDAYRNEDRSVMDIWKLASIEMWLDTVV